MPAVSRGTSASVMPRSFSSPSRPSGIVQAEREADHGRHRRQRDVALLEIHAHADHARAVPLALADDAVVGDRGRIRARGRAGQARSREFRGRRPGAAGNGPSAPRCRSAASSSPGPSELGTPTVELSVADTEASFSDHARMREGRETEAAVFLADDHAEELVLLEELPDFRRQVGAHVGDLPVVGHPADFFDRAVEEGLLFGRELRARLRQQDVPAAARRRTARLRSRPCRLPARSSRSPKAAAGSRVELEQRRGDAALAQRRDQHRQRRPPPAGRGDQRGGRMLAPARASATSTLAASAVNTASENRW